MSEKAAVNETMRSQTQWFLEAWSPFTRPVTPSLYTHHERHSVRASGGGRQTAEKQEVLLSEH